MFFIIVACTIPGILLNLTKYLCFCQFRFAIVYKKGYQEFDTVKSAVTTKLKGIVFSNSSDPGIGTRTWDVADYVIPPQVR